MTDMRHDRRILRRGAGAALILTALAIAVVGAPERASAQMGPDYWKVSGVASDDTLNIRSGPGVSYRVVMTAPNGAVFRNLGCEGTGDARWCHLETPSGGASGWAAGRYLVESGAPSASAGRDEVPELHVRGSGEIEVRYDSGCTALYNPAGRRVTAGASCSKAQLRRAEKAVDGHFKEQAGSDSHSGGEAEKVNVTGIGTIINGGALTGSIFGHSEGHYALTITGHGMTCTGSLDHAPGDVGSETTTINCLNGQHGTAILGQDGRLLTFNLYDGTAGYLKF